MLPAVSSGAALARGAEPTAPVRPVPRPGRVASPPLGCAPKPRLPMPGTQARLAGPGEAFAQAPFGLTPKEAKDPTTDYVTELVIVPE